MKDAELESYCDAVESLFFQWKGRPGSLSPRDFALVKRWFEEGVPLEEVLQGVADAFRAHESGRYAELEEVNSLAYCESFVRKRARG